MKKHDKGVGSLKINEAFVKIQKKASKKIIATFVGKVEISKRIAQNVRHSSKKKR